MVTVLGIVLGFLKPTASANVWVYHFCIRVTQAKENIKHAKDALLLPICSNLTGPDLNKSDWRFVFVCTTLPRIVFRFVASSVTVVILIFFPPLLQVLAAVKKITKTYSDGSP